MLADAEPSWPSGQAHERVSTFRMLKLAQISSCASTLITPPSFHLIGNDPHDVLSLVLARVFNVIVAAFAGPIQ